MSKIVFFSDTHNLLYRDYSHFTGADIAIFCGDMSNMGKREEILKFVSWYGKMPVVHKICIAGNHDFYLERAPADEIYKMFEENGITYLYDQEITICGLRIYGSPITPWFHDWAFNRYPGDDIAKHWDMINSGLDILVTHGPPKQILDSSYAGESCGCPQLLRMVMEKRPRIHAFGHIHEGYGMVKLSELTSAVDMMCESDIIFINAAVATMWNSSTGYGRLLHPIHIELEPVGSEK